MIAARVHAALQLRARTGRPTDLPKPTPAEWREGVHKIWEILTGEDIPAARETLKGPTAPMSFDFELSPLQHPFPKV
jgi:hypothetical protein